ncbi:MAG: hypothetical protein MZW92_14175 [Comamonadaceae bacterium]|nr:hypothetical protein [Comamonadaceae bacterium]
MNPVAAEARQRRRGPRRWRCSGAGSRGRPAAAGLPGGGSPRLLPAGGGQPRSGCRERPRPGADRGRGLRGGALTCGRRTSANMGLACSGGPAGGAARPTSSRGGVTAAALGHHLLWTGPERTGAWPACW